MFGEVENKGAVFLQLFARIKKEETGKQTRVKQLKEAEEKHLRRILKVYPMTDVEDAVKAMFKDPAQWAIKTQNDNPLHFLRNFERYLESAESLKERKEKAKEFDSEKSGDFDDAKEWKRKCSVEYLKSLKAGEWLGTLAETLPIAEEAAQGLTKEVKAEFWKQAQVKSEEIRREYKQSGNEPRTLAQISKFQLSSPLNLFSEMVVKEAVKIKYLPEWKF